MVQSTQLPILIILDAFTITVFSHFSIVVTLQVAATKIVQFTQFEISRLSTLNGTYTYESSQAMIRTSCPVIYSSRTDTHLFKNEMYSIYAVGSRGEVIFMSHSTMVFTGTLTE